MLTAKDDPGIQACLMLERSIHAKDDVGDVVLQDQPCVGCIGHDLSEAASDKLDTPPHPREGRDCTEDAGAPDYSTCRVWRREVSSLCLKAPDLTKVSFE